MKKLFGLMLCLFVLGPFMLGTTSNGDPSCNDVDDAKTEMQRNSLKESFAQTGMPAIHNWKELKDVKMLYELRDQENLQTYTYIVAEMTGKLIYVGRSVGYGIPYAVQYSAPKDAYGKDQAEPNGLFMPADAEGTWVMMIDPKGDVRPVYFEPRVVVSPFKLTAE